MGNGIVTFTPTRFDIEHILMLSNCHIRLTSRGLVQLFARKCKSLVCCLVLLGKHLLFNALNLFKVDVLTCVSNMKCAKMTFMGKKSFGLFVGYKNFTYLCNTKCKSLNKRWA